MRVLSEQLTLLEEFPTLNKIVQPASHLQGCSVRYRARHLLFRLVAVFRYSAGSPFKRSSDVRFKRN